MNWRIGGTTDCHLERILPLPNRWTRIIDGTSLLGRVGVKCTGSGSEIMVIRYDSGMIGAMVEFWFCGLKIMI